MQKQNLKGFTIVELLIVIVVIGILAAITIVAYSGIQNRARTSAVSGALTQTVKRLEVYAVDSTGYPLTLATVGINNTADTVYQYSVDNSVSPATYCVTATNGTISYKVSSTSTAPSSGGCAGHGVGGVAAVTNLITNPSFESNLSGCSYAGPAAPTLTRVSSGGAVSGTSFFRATYSAAAASEVVIACTVPATAGQTYTAVVNARPSWAGAQMRMQFQWNLSSGTAWTASASTAATQNAWNARTFSAVAPANTVSTSIQSSFTLGTKPAIGDTFDADAYMLTDGNNSYGFADGNSSNWAWTSTINNSTSTGPPL